LKSRYCLFGQFGQFKGHNSEVPAAMWLVFMFGRDGMPLGVVTKFQEYPIKTI